MTFFLIYRLNSNNNMNDIKHIQSFEKFNNINIFDSRKINEYFSSKPEDSKYFKDVVNKTSDTSTRLVQIDYNGKILESNNYYNTKGISFTDKTDGSIIGLIIDGHDNFIRKLYDIVLYYSDDVELFEDDFDIKDIYDNETLTIKGYDHHNEQDIELLLNLVPLF